MNFKLQVPLWPFINLSEYEMNIVRNVQISDYSFKGTKSSYTKKLSEVFDFGVRLKKKERVFTDEDESILI